MGGPSTPRGGGNTTPRGSQLTPRSAAAARGSAGGASASGPSPKEVKERLSGPITAHIGSDAAAFSLLSKTDRLMGDKPTFEEKDRQADGGTASSLTSALNASGVGIACRKGMKPESPNQDSFGLVVADQGFKIFAVFDGHGPKGHDVSAFVSEYLTKLFVSHKERDASPSHALQESFILCQKMLETLDPFRTISMDSGSTCTFAYLPAGEDVIHLAHVGDSRACLSRGGHALEVTQDHKPDLKEEKARIERAGGMVVFDGYFNHRIYSSDGRGGLNMSRAFGDNAAQKFGVTAQPTYRRVDINTSKPEKDSERDQFLLLCSDGVWEFLKSQAVCDVVLRHGRSEAQKAAEEIAKASYDAWMADSEGEVSDDITVVLVWL